MRQGDGSDLPGVNSPHSTNIGIIYVAPNDDRQSILAAILTQERLGRKQVAIVLPDQNKAFQRPVDFDGLKNMRGGLKVQIVFVTSAGSVPAELARQRRFPVFSSLDNYAKDVREREQSTVVTRKGWLSPLFRQKPAGASSAAPTNPTRPGQVQPPANTAGTSAQAQQAATKNDNAKDDSGALPGAAVTGDATVIDSGILAASGGDLSAPTNAQDESDALAPAVPIEEAQSATSSLPVSEDTPTEKNIGVQSSDAWSVAADNPKAKIIPLSSARGGTTDKIVIPPITSTPAAQPQVPQMSPVSSTAQTRPQNAGRIASIGTGAGLAAAGRSSAQTVRAAQLAALVKHLLRAAGRSSAQTVRAGATPPTRGSAASPGGGPSGPRLPIRRRLLITLVALVAACGVIAYASSGMLSHFNLPNIVPGLTPSATVTITPASKDLKNNYTIFAVTDNPDSSLRQVQARQLTSTTPARTKTATATGVGHTPGVQATGIITFYNGASVDQLVSAGTTFTLGGGVQVVTDQNVDVPPASPPSFGIARALAHAVSVGTSGNIDVLTINQSCCSSKSIFAKNLTPFTGGQDPQAFTFVQQSDIDGVVNPLKMTLMPAAQQSLQAQVQSDERFLKTPQCTPNVSSNHAAGDQASSVTVTVKVTCSGEVYDLQGVQTMAANLLKQQAATDPGPGYALAGNLVTGITQFTLTNPSKGTLELFDTAEGIWVYQFSDAQKAMLAKLIAGKSKQVAQTLLLQQMGVARVDIQLSGGDGKTLPTDTTHITIDVLTVLRLQGTTPSTPTTGLGSPTVPTTAPGYPTVTPKATPTVGLGIGAG
jgi:hypothetical protein